MLDNNKYCEGKDNMIRILSDCSAILDKVVIAGLSEVMVEVIFEQKPKRAEEESQANV